MPLPVIFINFKDIKYLDYTRVYEGIATLIMELYGNHRYLLEDDLLHEDEKIRFTALLYKNTDPADVENAIKQLAVYV
ncbi:MAG: hypothetical protein MTP17_00945 [Candidatus Midichloria sp.]|nr:MAG: hypothetical protein MTP17_00945 [Candidatus Midichloria sp.]